VGLSGGRGCVWTTYRLHLSASGKQVAVKATGGGAYKFQEEFREQLGIELQKQDEMRSLVAGSDFFLRAIEDEVFTFQTGVVRSLPACRRCACAQASVLLVRTQANGLAHGSHFGEGNQHARGLTWRTLPSVSWHRASPNDDAYESLSGALQRHYVQDQPIYPYLLVNIGSGVSIVKVQPAVSPKAPNESKLTLLLHEMRYIASDAPTAYVQLNAVDSFGAVTGVARNRDFLFTGGGGGRLRAHLRH
jgi:hypothetical protein